MNMMLFSFIFGYTFALVAAQDPFPGCEDSAKLNCSDVTLSVCGFESAYLVCPRTCNLCDHNPSYHPCRDHIEDISCADLSDPCSDAVGLITCPLFCGTCSAPTTTIILPTTRLSSTTRSTTPSSLTKPNIGPCDASPCVNGGSCISMGFMFTCSCPQGHSGPFCNIVVSTTRIETSFTSTVSQTAVITPTAGTAQYTGGLCALKPCLNGGICSDTNGGFVCLCPPGFSHPLCSPISLMSTTGALHPQVTSSTTEATTKAQETTTAGFCALRPCMNGGVCSIVNGGFVCLCPPGFEHPVCSPVTTISPTKTPQKTTTQSPTLKQSTSTLTTITPDVCLSNPCLHGGTCRYNRPDDPCHCPPGYDKPFCTYTGDQCHINKYELGCRPADVIFMIEHSRMDANGCRIPSQGDFIKEFLSRWEKNSPRMRVGVVAYHHNVEQRIQLTDYKNNLRGLSQAVTDITGSCNNGHQVGGLIHPGHRTPNLAKAFDFVGEHSFNESRHGVPKIVIPIISSPMLESFQEGWTAASHRLKAKCVTVMPVVIHNIHNDAKGNATAHWMSSHPYDVFYTEFTLQQFNDPANLQIYGSNCH